MGIKMERSVSVSSNRNIQDHLWRKSAYFGPNIPPEVPSSVFNKTALIREFGKGIKNGKNYFPIDWNSLIVKYHSVFLGYFH